MTARVVHGHLRQLLQTGGRFYSAGADPECAEAYHRATQLAAGIGDVEGEVLARFWEACALHRAGRLRRALVAVAPALGRPDVSLAQSSAYRASTRYLRSLVELPAPRHGVEAGISDVERGLLEAGRPGWLSRITVVRARLALSTGEWSSCQRLARESLEQAAEDAFRFSRSTSCWLGVLSSIWIGELDPARAWLERWRSIDLSDPYQETCRSWMHSCWHRRAGRLEEALPHARQAYVQAQSANSSCERLLTGLELARVLLGSGELEAAREPLSTIARLRHTEVGEHRFAIRTLFADWHLAHARCLAALPGLDPEFHHRLPPRGRAGRADPPAAHSALARARRAYGQLRVQARALDGALDCSLRDWQLNDRLASVAATQEEIG